jgi:predicted metal-binding protein
VSENVDLERVIVQVCVTCRAEGDLAEPRAGARLHAALAAARAPGDPQVEAIECFSVCKRPCTISFAAPGAWTYVYGDFPADTSPVEVLSMARAYGQAPRGLIPWKERPAALKKGVVARLPPLERAS